MCNLGPIILKMSFFFVRSEIASTWEQSCVWQLLRHSDGRWHGRREVVVQRRLDRVAASRLHGLIRVQIVRANVLQLAQVRVEVLFRGRGGRIRLVCGFDMMAEDGDDIAAKVFVIRAEAASGAACATASTTYILKILKNIMTVWEFLVLEKE